jgi:hypothetical protein
MPANAESTAAGILRDLCLFDEHTWGASFSVSAPYSLRTLGQYVEKSDLAYRQLCIVHLVRAGLNHVNWKERKKVAADLNWDLRTPQTVVFCNVLVREGSNTARRHLRLRR